MKINNQDELISIIAERSRFIKKDVKIIFNELVNLMEELVFTDDGSFPNKDKPKVLMKVRDFGILKIKRIPERKGNDGRDLPPTVKVIFTLSEKIRYAGRNHEDISDEIGDDLDLTEDE